MAKSTRTRPPVATPRPPKQLIALTGADGALGQQLGRALADPQGCWQVATGCQPHADLTIAIKAQVSQPAILRSVRQASAAAVRSPLLVMVPRVTPRVNAAVLDAGADDCVSLRIAPVELRARIRALLRRCACDRAASPLTGLPGNVQLEEDLSARIANNVSAALVAFDLRDFKPFNDCYGYVRGDQVLRFVAELLTQTAGAVDPPPVSRVYHIGGDDFFVLTQPNLVSEIADAVMAAFEAGISQHYDAEDAQRGYISGLDRVGQATRFPLMALVAAAVTWQARETPHPGELARSLAAMKEGVRKRRGSVFVCRPAAT